MRHVILIAIVIVAHAGNTSYAQSRSAINDWLSVQACQITFQIPQDLKRNRREGIDSCIVEFESRKILLSIDYGWYGGATEKSDVTLDFREQSFPIDGKTGTLVTYVDDSLYGRNHPQRKYVAHVFIVVESIERKGFPSEPMVTSLMMTVSGHSFKDLDVAKRIFRSVRFQSTARRTSAWSGLAVSGLLCSVAWARRSSATFGASSQSRSSKLWRRGAKP